MNKSAATAHRRTSNNSNQQPHPGIALRVKRALLLAGTLGLLLGAVLGTLQIHPEALSAWLPVEVEQPGVALIGMSLIGLIGGMLAGLLLGGTTFLLRQAVALVGLVAALIGVTVVQSAAPGLLSDALKVSQFCLGVSGAIIGILAEQRRHIRPEPAQSTPIKNTNHRPARRPSQPPQKVSRKRETLQPVITVARPDSRVKISVPASRHPRWQIWRQRQGVHLGKEVSSVCPYCLEEVKPNDPRGRVVCDICGTPHHGDCWAITGKCQVPHLQT